MSDSSAFIGSILSNFQRSLTTKELNSKRKDKARIDEEDN